MRRIILLASSCRYTPTTTTYPTHDTGRLTPPQELSQRATLPHGAQGTQHHRQTLTHRAQTLHSSDYGTDATSRYLTLNPGLETR